MLPPRIALGVVWFGQYALGALDGFTVNIFLIPYTWFRHLAMAFWCAAWGLAGWAAVLTIFVKLSPSWHPAMDGSILISTLAGVVAFASIAGEAALRRRSIFQSIWRVVLSTGLSVGLSMVAYWFWTEVVNRMFFSDQAAIDAVDSTLVSLRYRVGVFFLAGLASGLGPMVLRKGEGWINHVAGGAAAGLAGGLAWHFLNFQGHGSDLFLAGAALGAVWGFVHGLLVWGIPDDLYAGWIRVLTLNRYSRRIPVDALQGGPQERFVGHFTRGLDLFLAPEDGVAEMHISVAVDDTHRYAVRGLSLAPTRVKRFLERIDLRYDPGRPAPLQTQLKSGDRIEMGEGEARAEVEFIMLPKEEQ
jgi:hypothetical protein